MKLDPNSVIRPEIIGAVLGAKAFAIGEWVQVGDYEPGLITGGLPLQCIGQAWRPYQVSFPSDRALWSERQIKLLNSSEICRKISKRKYVDGSGVQQTIGTVYQGINYVEPLLEGDRVCQ